MDTPFKDKAGFREIFKQYFSPLTNFVYSRYIQDYELAKDIVQATFGKIWEKKDKIQISSSVKSYLFQAVRNRALDHIRSHADKSVELQESFREYDVADEQNDVDERSYMIREEISKVLKTFKPKMREIFELNKFRGLTYDEIADEMGIAKRTVENNMARAFGILREQLKKSEIFSQ